MDSILIVNVHAVIDVAEDENHALRVLRTGRDNSVQTFRLFVQIVMGLDIFQQIHSKLIQAKIHNGNAGGHILNINDFLMQPL